MKCVCSVCSQGATTRPRASLCSFKDSIHNESVLVLCLSHPIIIHIAFIQSPVAMAATASIPQDEDASFFPERMSHSSHICHPSTKMTHSTPLHRLSPLKHASMFMVS